MKLKDKVAVITGGAKGIGQGCARVFGKYGALHLQAGLVPQRAADSG
jgi:NAD(P)-dependent dehydrogenase (short-subunit alcohol dehydrogenase family)